MAAQILNKVKATDIELKDKLVAVNRVTKVTKGGRNFTFSAIVVVGDEHGIVGHGLGKAKEVTEAITKGIEDAKKNLIKVPILKGTVPHTQKGKFGGAEVLLKPAANGTGVIAGGAMRAVLESVGVQGATGDPTTGCYLGHGNTEGQYEGWYNSSRSDSSRSLGKFMFLLLFT